MKSFKCSICGKRFFTSSNTKKHIAGRRSGCRDAVVQRVNIVIRASDRVVGGREHVSDHYRPPQRVPSIEDEEPHPGIDPGHSADKFEKEMELEPELADLEGFFDSDFRWLSLFL